MPLQGGDECRRFEVTRFIGWLVTCIRVRAPVKQQLHDAGIAG